MIYLPNDKIVMVDCDDTLVMWDEPVKDISVYQDGFLEHLTVNAGNVEELKNKYNSGYTIIVWSAGGSSWAKAVVEALQLQKYVSLVMAKPSFYIDDLPCQEFMGKRLWEEK